LFVENTSNGGLPADSPVGATSVGGNASSVGDVDSTEA